MSVTKAIQDSKAPDSRLDSAGSFFVPSKQLLAQMRYRPWSGVYLSDDYLSSVDAAEAITRGILRAYHRAGVVPLIETRIQVLPQLQQALRLLEQGAELDEGALSGSLVTCRHASLDIAANPQEDERGRRKNEHALDSTEHSINRKRCQDSEVSGRPQLRMRSHSANEEVA
jgi:hypothetical protein